jgi:hypothetical protein
MNDINEKNISDRRSVVLPCEPEHFRDFIAGLLGRPQTIERFVPGRFEIERGNVEDLYHLLDQRISSQNDATLIQFTARIIYDDDSSVLLNSFFDFAAYNEVRPLISRGIYVTWTFLVKFRNKQYPEKQQIEVGFSTSVDYGTSKIRELIPERIVSQKPGMIFRVNHTDRSWGTDMEALLTGYLQTLVRRDTPLRERVRRYSGWIGLGCGTSLLVSLIFFSLKIFDRLNELRLAVFRFETADAVTTLAQIAKQQELILRAILKNPNTEGSGYFVLFAFGSLIVSLIAGVIIGLSAADEKQSFVLLTAKSQEERRNSYKSDKQNWRIFIGSLMGALIVSVFGNYLFYLIVKHLLEI